MEFDVLASADLTDGEMAPVTAGAESIALVRIDGVVHALANVCTHQFALMTDGYFDGACLECPLHQGLFDAKTGAPVDGPVTEPLRRFSVREDGGRILVTV